MPIPEVTRFGSAKRLSEQPELRLQANRDSFTLTETHQVPFTYAEIKRLLAQLGSRQAELPGAELTTIRANRLPGEHLRIELDYTGTPGEVSGNMGQLEEPEYQLSTDIRQEVIQGHPKFDTDEMAGTPGDPKNGAIFDDVVDSKGEIKKLPNGENAKYFKEWDFGSKFYKTTHFEIRTPRWTKTYTAQTAPNLTRIGRIDSPEGGAPGWTAPWLFSNVGFTFRGGVYRITKEWEGLPRGNTDANRVIYG
jgi:hypothetical protein